MMMMNTIHVLVSMGGTKSSTVVCCTKVFYVGLIGHSNRFGGAMRVCGSMTFDLPSLHNLFLSLWK